MLDDELDELELELLDDELDELELELLDDELDELELVAALSSNTSVSLL